MYQNHQQQLYATSTCKYETNLLPNFKEFLTQTIPTQHETASSPVPVRLSCNNNQLVSNTIMKSEGFHPIQHVDFPRFEAISQSSSSSSCDGYHTHVDLQSDQSNNPQVSYLYQKIDELERRIFEQTHIISNLVKENQSLKSKKIEKPTTCRKKLSSLINHTHSSNNYSKPMTLVQETSFIESSESGVFDLNQFLVNWNGTQYVIINVFKNRDEIMNYYCPLYQTKHPNKEFKLVVQCDEYKKLFKENQHIKTSEKKQAWRISLFTIDFYNFVKNHVRV